MADFSSRLLRWYRPHGRHDLPWQVDPTPYRVWVSEIMLQQTQVTTVVPYFRRFMERFPDAGRLAAAPLDDVLAVWSGLGYYGRARHLHRAAGIICRDFDGELPASVEALVALPGIGRSTAGAILSLGHNQPAAILDGNVRRVLARYHGIDGWPGERSVESTLWTLAEQHLPRRSASAYTQAIMDLGATVCTRKIPRCEACPVAGDCSALSSGSQHRIPAARPRRVLPIRKTVMAMLENPCGEILLQRRPAAGIWAGLWSFPECPQELDVVDWVRRSFDLEVLAYTPQPALRHTFTHFHLDITPVRLLVRHRVRHVNEVADRAWFAPAAAEELGIAAPVRKLIRTCREHHIEVEGR